jgi:hypothetical protein
MYLILWPGIYIGVMKATLSEFSNIENDSNVCDSCLGK